jgi:hypothetical protein
MVNNVYRRSLFYTNVIDNLTYKDAYTSWYKIPCECKHTQKWSYTYATKDLPHPIQEIKHTLSYPANEWKLLDLDLVKISACWSGVGTWIKVIFPFSTLSLKKWYITSMCLVLEWSTLFFATLMALVLSHRSGTWVYSSPKSLMVYVIQRSWEQQLAAATYSTSVVDWATLDCLREDQDTKEEFKN